MTKKNLILLYGVLFTMMLSLSSCSSDDSAGSEDIPFTADIFRSIAGKKVAFQGLTNNATSWLWDFGDGTTSTEQNPVHNYPGAGYYETKFTATSADGTTITKETRIGIEITPYVLLTGGASAPNGKTWKIDAVAANNRFANADQDLTAYSEDLEPLPAGVFGQLGLGSIYNDEFTFHFDGSYSMDLKEDGAAFSIYFYQDFISGGSDIVKVSADPNFPFVTATFSLDPGTTFEYNEQEDYTVPTYPGGMLTYPGVTTLDFTNNGFVGYLDFQRKVIVQEITENRMRLVLFVVANGALVPGGAAPFALNSNALVFTFTAVE
ncbi:PKD domain-containing protein [Arenibacter sp. M-2]|uniref:PKD domain-containing protein n=1 Tax=Arenibacter sp. M-2 TaxID=3053612 RepID=UPI00257031E2|nr:PKD domain-containing protein [Arenibacter sp. M-2]MDL5510695.1 PKD domain-containing protein [Arenibacter sp. M-2]